MLTADSTLPFPWLRQGDDFVLVNPYSCTRERNASIRLANSGPLSVMYSSGSPYRAKFFFMARMTVLANVLRKGSSSKCHCNGQPGRGNCCHRSALTVVIP